MAFKGLDELRIDDPILRGYLRRDILEKVNDYSDESVVEYFVNIDEEYRPDLLSLRFYGTESLRWIPTLVAKNDGETEGLPVGDALRLPSDRWIRDQIRHYEEDGSLRSRHELKVFRRGKQR